MIITKSLLFCAGILCCILSCSQDFKKLSDKEVDSVKVEIAQKFATDYLTASKNGTYYQFADEAIDVIKNQLTPETQKAVYNQLRDEFGDFQTLEYAETWIQSSNSSMHIIRFKSEFKRSNKKLEVRVVLNESDKIAGFWVRPWSDIL